jgi:uncharacterized membrane protein
MDIAWGVLLPAATVFTLGAISPGPSLLVVLRNTLIGGRRRGVACALGHGIGFGMYALWSVFGLIYLLEEHRCIMVIRYGNLILLKKEMMQSNRHTKVGLRDLQSPFLIQKSLCSLLLFSHKCSNQI